MMRTGFVCKACDVVARTNVLMKAPPGWAVVEYEHCDSCDCVDYFCPACLDAAEAAVRLCGRYTVMR